MISSITIQVHQDSVQAREEQGTFYHREAEIFPFVSDLPQLQLPERQAGPPGEHLQKRTTEKLCSASNLRTKASEEPGWARDWRVLSEEKEAGGHQTLPTIPPIPP